MNVLIVTSSFPKGPQDPSGHFVMEDALRRQVAGSKVTVIAPGDPRRPNWQPPNIRVIRLFGGKAFGFPGALPRLRQQPLRIFSALRFTVNACALARALGPFDQVIAHWLMPAAFPVALFAQGSKLAVVHGSDIRMFCKFPSPVRRAVLTLMHRQNFSFRVVSAELGTMLRRVSHLPFEISVEPAPIDLGEGLSRSEARAHLGLPNELTMLLWVGRLVTGKRTEVALEAASLVPGARAFVIGQGPEYQRLEERYPEVTFLGALPRNMTLIWIAAADLLLSTSRTEGAPTTVREARGLDTPVVACDAGDLRAWARHDPDLWVVD